MELLAVCIVLAVTYIPGCFGRSLATEPHITAIMSHQPTMTCKYDFKGMTNDWVVIRWSRYENETKVQLAILQKGSYADEWSESVPSNFKDHVELLNNIGSTSVSFDMRIDGFKCSDVGKYICEVITLNGDHSSTTEMHIKVNPEMPKIQEDIIQVNENESFAMRCHGYVGMPPTTLRWSYMLKGRDIYQLAESGVTQENSPPRECMIKGTSTMELTMTPEFDGAAFVCYTGVDIVVPGDGRKYAQVILELPGKPTTQPPTTTKMPCMGENCDKSFPSVDDAAPRSVQVAVSTLLVSLFISLLVVRTS